MTQASESQIQLNLSAICLAAGEGRRLEPITLSLPKALCPIGPESTLLERALELASIFSERSAVNVHFHAQLVEEWLDASLFVPFISRETEMPLGTAGALGHLKRWIGSDDVMVINADAFVVGDLSDYVGTWDREHIRLLVVPDTYNPDFAGVWRYVGIALVPNRHISTLSATPSGLYEALFRSEYESGTLELFPSTAFAIDCGTPLDLLLANLTHNSGRTVVARGARCQGVAISSLIMPGATVSENEHIEWSVRLQDGSTLHPTHKAEDTTINAKR